MRLHLNTEIVHSVVSCFDMSSHGSKEIMLLKIIVNLPSPLKFKVCVPTITYLSRMISSTLIEVFGHTVISFTRGVTEQFDSEEPEFTAESLGYDPLESTGPQEWNYRPFDEFIFQEYSERGNTQRNTYPPSRTLAVRVMNACSLEENEDQRDEDEDMAWKRLRPSVLRTFCKSMYTGALISFLSATTIGSLSVLFTYLSYKTVLNCQFRSMESIPIQLQWMRCTAKIAVSPFFIYSSLSVYYSYFAHIS